MTVLSDRVDALEATNANLVTILTALQGTLQAAVDAGQGPQGWSPVLTVQSDGARRVLQVTDWTGGGAGATKPDTGDYIGSTGLVAAIGDAIDIRGPSGADGDGWTGATYDAGTGVVTFTSDDGLGFATGDIRGDKGDPGALFNWTGPWITATAYAEGDGVENDGSSYVCISAHTSGATTEPGVGGSASTVWDLTAAKGDPGSGDVSSVDVTGGTGITSSGGPITSTGAITVALDSATQTSLGLADTAQQPPSEGAFVDGDKTKLDGIETGADVTDPANVTAAGALMDSEVTNLAAVKSFNPADYVQPGDDADTLGSGAATDGQVLTADGAGGAAWEDAGGGLVPLSKSVVSSSTSNVIFTLPSGYSAYKLIIFGLRNDSKDEILTMNTSTDGGTSFDNGASDYHWYFSGTSQDDSTGDTSIHLSGSGTDDQDFQANPNFSARVEIDLRPGGAGEYGSAAFAFRAIVTSFHGIGYRLSTTPFDAVRLQLLNPILEGTFYLYGVKEPA